MDLLEVRQEMNAFFEPGRAKTSLKLVESAGDPATLEIQYDVSQRYSYSGVSIRLDDLDITQRRELVLEVRGDAKEGFPDTIKAELKFRGEYVQFEHIPVKPNWTEARIPLPAGSAKVDELAFVLENSAAGTHRKGKVSVRSLSLR